MSTLSRDFLRLLREDPDFRDEVRRELLSNELIELPEKFTSFVERTEAFMEQTQAFMEQTQAFIERTEAFMEQTQAFMKQTQAFVERTEAFMERTEAFMEQMRLFVEQTQAFMAQTQQEFSEVKTRLTGVEDAVGRLDSTVSSLTGTVGRLDGREYERRVSRTLTGEVSRVLGLRRGRLVYSAAYGLHQSFQDQMEDELDAERITQSQWQELLNTDAIIRAGEGGKTVFAVAGISVTVHEEDIIRAVERAAIIYQATGLTTYPVVVGSRIPQPQLVQAEARNVTTVTMQQQGE